MPIIGLNPLWVLFWVLLAASVVWSLYRLMRACEAATQADWGDPWTTRIAGFIGLFCRYMHRFQFDPIPLPAEGSALVAANHISGLDPFLLIAASPRPLRFLIAREEYERFGLNWLFRRAQCIPVDRERNPERALREALRALNNGEVVAVFPQGRIHLPTAGLRKLKGGVVRLAHQCDCKIYPVRVSDVRAAGHTALAVIVPSRSRLRTFSELDCNGQSHDDCLALLAERLGLTSQHRKA
jgi:1-acyl-sn-glycerol-3-phosphate acyltransferase